MPLPLSVLDIWLIKLRRLCLAPFAWKEACGNEMVMCRALGPMDKGLSRGYGIWGVDRAACSYYSASTKLTLAFQIGRGGGGTELNRCVSEGQALTITLSSGRDSEYVRASVQERQAGFKYWF